MSERKSIRKAVRRQAPRAYKRTAPRPKPTPEDILAKDRRLGRPTTFRLDPQVRTALDMASDKYNVRKRDLVEFLLRAGLHMVDTGRIELPISEDTGPSRLNLPDLPDNLIT